MPAGPPGPTPRRGRARRFIARAFLLLAVLAIATFGVAWMRSTNACDGPAAATPHTPMKAWTVCEYGGPEVVTLSDLERPVPAATEVLVRVRATSVNPVDWHGMRGTPYLARFVMGLRKPANTRLGTDFAGTIEAVGADVSGVAVGDSVFGAKSGAFAEYVAVPAHEVVRMPSRLTFEQAAAIPVAGTTALQGVRDHAKVAAGQHVLINGASGGVGTFAVQVAKALGATVTGVQSTRNLELVRGLGADHVIDYTAANFTRDTVRYDAIVDNVGNHGLSALQGVLTPEGRYVMIGGPAGRWLDPLPRAISVMLRARVTGRSLEFFIAQLKAEDLAFLARLVEEGKLTPAIDRTFTFDQMRDAIAYQETGKARAKVVVTVP